MKKFFMMAAAALTMLAASCAGTADADCEAYLKSIDSVTVAMENCKDVAEMQTIATAFEAKAKAFEAKYAKDSEATVSKDLEKKLEDAAAKYLEVATKKASEFAAAAQQAAPAEVAE